MIPIGPQSAVPVTTTLTIPQYPTLNDAFPAFVLTNL